MKIKATSFFFLILLLLPVVTQAQTAEEIIAKVFAARGGLDKIRSINSQRISGRIQLGQMAGPFFVELKRPLKMHMQLTMQNLTMFRVYNGKSGWANNPFEGKMNAAAMSDEELRNINDEADFDGPIVDYKQKGNQVELMGKDKVNDRDVWRLKLTTKNGDIRYYLYDANTFLLLEWQGRRRYAGQDVPVETFFSDYRDVDGLKMPFELDSGSSPSNIMEKITIASVQLNPQINDAEFEKPVTPEAPVSSSASSPNGY
jgi:outer membrane lipoprotein-sorting protein